MNFVIDEGKKEPEVFRKLDTLSNLNTEFVKRVYLKLTSSVKIKDYQYIVLYSETDSACICQSDIIVDGYKDCNVPGAEPCAQLNLGINIPDNVNTSFLISDFISYCEKRNII